MTDPTALPWQFQVPNPLHLGVASGAAAEDIIAHRWPTITSTPGDDLMNTVGMRYATDAEFHAAVVRVVEVIRDLDLDWPEQDTVSWVASIALHLEHQLLIVDATLRAPRTPDGP